VKSTSRKFWRSAPPVFPPHRVDAPACGTALERWPVGPAPCSPGDPFRILYVCSANVCRSVMAERLTSRAIAQRLTAHRSAFEVGSAGLRATPDQAAHPYALAALARFDLDACGFATRVLTAPLLERSDLVLAATARQRDHVVELLPAAARRTFTIREFARIAAHAANGPHAAHAAAPSPDPPPERHRPTPVHDLVGRARRLVDLAATLRGQVGYVAARAEDIADPPLRLSAFYRCADRISQAVDDCVGVLCGDGRTAPSAAGR
jgi:protein-tyrosine phosphatase